MSCGPNPKLRVKGPNQLNDVSGTKIEDAKSREGKIEAVDETGRGSHIKKAEAKRDVIARPTASRSNPDPKA